MLNVVWQVIFYSKLELLFKFAKVVITLTVTFVLGTEM